MAKPPLMFYFVSKNAKKTLTLTSRNMQVSVLEINSQTIIIMLNMFLYLSDSRHIKSRYRHVAIESLTEHVS